LWSLGMVLARSCALTAVSAFLATWLHRKEDTVRQQLREFCYEATAKRGTARQELVVETCFAPLLAWVVDQWEGTQLALALDATTLGTRFTVLALSVVYRGCAIPVAWTVLAATATHAWRREWLRMLRQGRPAVARSWALLGLGCAVRVRSPGGWHAPGRDRHNCLAPGVVAHAAAGAPGGAPVVDRHRPGRSGLVR